MVVAWRKRNSPLGISFGIRKRRSRGHKSRGRFRHPRSRKSKGIGALALMLGSTILPGLLRR